MFTKTILTFLCCLTIFFYDILTFSLRPYFQSSMKFFRVIYPFALQDRNLKVRNNKQHYSVPKVIYKTKRFDGPLEKTPENKNLELLRNTIPYERSLNSRNTNIIINKMSFGRLYYMFIKILDNSDTYGRPPFLGKVKEHVKKIPVRIIY